MAQTTTTTVTLADAADAGLAALFAALPAFERALDPVVRRAMRAKFSDADEATGAAAADPIVDQAAAGVTDASTAAQTAPPAAAASDSSAAAAPATAAAQSSPAPPLRFPKWLRVCRSVVPAAKLEDVPEPWDAYAAVKIVKAKLEDVFLDVAGIVYEFAKPEAAEGLRVACETVIVTRMWFAHSPSPNPAEVRNALQAMLVILERLTGSQEQEAMVTLHQLIEMLQSAVPCTVPLDAYARFALDRFFVTRFEATLNPWLKEKLGPDRFLVQSDPKVERKENEIEK